MHASTIASLNTRLDSIDADVVWSAAIETFLKSERSDAELFVLSKAAHAANTTKGRTFKSFIDELIGAGFSKSPATVKNYKAVWPIAALTVAENVDPTPEHVAMAYRIVANTNAKPREAWLKTCPEALAERAAWLEAAFARYRELDAEFSPKADEADAADEAGTEEAEVVTDSAANGFDGTLSNLQSLAGRIQRGEFTLAEALQLAQAAKGIIVATEALANAAIKAPVAA